MNLEIIHNFEKFLENRGYSPQTIHAYTKALEQAPDSWNVTETQLLYEHINYTLADNNQTFSPSTRHNIGSASSLLFQMQTGEVFRNYDRNQKYKTTRHKELLEEFFKYSTEFKHITSMSATAECHHIPDGSMGDHYKTSGILPRQPFRQKPFHKAYEICHLFLF